MQNNKTKQLGRTEREGLIDAEWPGQRSRLVAEMSALDFKQDDLNDAFAALWTAKRILLGTARVLGPQTIDRNGLRMEMWAW
jgi:predicted RNase H-like nuclease